MQEYLRTASAYIYNSTEATISVNDVRGIWVSSDDAEIVSAIKQSFVDFFPNVEPGSVVWISGRAFQTTAASEGTLPTMANVMVREARKMDVEPIVIITVRLFFFIRAFVFFSHCWILLEKLMPIEALLHRMYVWIHLYICSKRHCSSLTLRGVELCPFSYCSRPLHHRPSFSVPSIFPFARNTDRTWSYLQSLKCCLKQTFSSGPSLQMWRN